MTYLDPNHVKAFWRQRALSGSTRWTDDAFLLFEQSLLVPLMPANGRILDLGSGFGELSRSICPIGGTLMAVDHEELFSSAFKSDERFRFICNTVDSFEIEERFDVALLFGVVTHLTRDRELATYRKINEHLDKGGLAIVKNQCSDGEEFAVDQFSAELNCRYQGRYPSVSDQEALLGEVFSSVSTTVYPLHLKRHPNSSHVLFTCRR